MTGPKSINASQRAIGTASDVAFADDDVADDDVADEDVAAEDAHNLIGDVIDLEVTFALGHAVARAAVLTMGTATFLAASLLGGIFALGGVISGSAAEAWSAAVAAGKAPDPS